jgi:hypothetical protein
MILDVLLISCIAVLGTYFFYGIGEDSKVSKLLYVLPVGFVAFIGYLLPFALISRATLGGISHFVILLGPAFFLMYLNRNRALKIDWYSILIVATSVLVVLVIYNFAIRKALFSPDSFAILGNSELFRSGLSTSFGYSDEISKRGVTLPVLHSTVAPGRFSSSLAPFVSTLLLVLTLGVINESIKKFNWPRKSLILGIVATIGLVTTYQFRSNFFYLNTHSLVAVLILGILAVGFLSSQEDWESSSIIAITGMGIALSLSRAEGFLVYLVLVSSLMPQFGQNHRTIRKLVLAPMILVVFWNMQLFFNDMSIQTPVLVALVSIVGTISLLVISQKNFSWLTRDIHRYLLLAMVIAVLVSLFRRSESVLKSASACFENLESYWGPTLGVLLVSTIAVAITSRRDSLPYKLAMTGLSLVLFMFVTKSFDGGLASDLGICRAGWGDSINRGWMHYVAVFVVVFALGFTLRSNSQQKSN